MRISPTGTPSRTTKRQPSRSRLDPFTLGRRSFERGEPLNADFGSNCSGWPPISAQCLYEMGRLKSATLAAKAECTLARASRGRKRRP